MMDSEVRCAYHHRREHKNIARLFTGTYQAIKERHTKYAKFQPLEFNALDAALLKSKLNVHMKKGECARSTEAAPVL